MRTCFKILFSAALVTGIYGLTQTLQAQPIYLNGASTSDPDGFIGHYNTESAGEGTTMANCFSCYICHMSFPENAQNLSPYALAWRAAWVNLEPARIIDEAPNANSDAAFVAIESADSDGDGASNLTEIQANSNPGSATSTPSSPGVCPNAPAQAAGGGTVTTASESGLPYNANALDTKCGFSSGAGMLKVHGSPAQEAETMALFFLPLLTLLALRTWIPSNKF